MYKFILKTSRGLVAGNKFTVYL